MWTGRRVVHNRPHTTASAIKQHGLWQYQQHWYRASTFTTLSRCCIIVIELCCCTVSLQVIGDHVAAVWPSDRPDRGASLMAAYVIGETYLGGRIKFHACMYPPQPR